MPQENLGQSVSLWMATAAMPKQNTLEQDTHADVCIVGAGIAGITTAYLLAKEGKSVIVLDDGDVGGGQTQRTTAHLSNALDDRYFEIERLHGLEGAKLAAASHTAAIDRIESIVNEEQIACDFVRLDGYLVLPPGESDELLTRELAAAHRAGLSDVERLSRAQLFHFDSGPCLRFPRQAQFHPLKYLTAVARAIQHAGGRIFTGSHVETIAGGKQARIRTSSGRTVTADAVVVATNSPINDLLAIHTKQAAYMTYAIGAIIPRGVVPTALYWDTLHPYHYVRVHPHSTDFGMTEKNGSEWHDLLIVGGEDHKTGQAPAKSDPYARLEEWARERFPMIREVKFRWSGQVMETIDGLAFIGRNPLDYPNVFIVTGDSGMGMTHGTIAGILLTDLILGRENPWTSLYDPSRKNLRALEQFVKENFNLAKQYGDWLTRGDVDSIEQIKTGEGAVMRHGLTKMAVYRDEQGMIHERSAICTHLGGIVHWNDAEKTWDCPCHGSRFDRLGGVINGPANRDLDGSDSDCEKCACDSTTDANGKTHFAERQKGGVMNDKVNIFCDSVQEKLSSLEGRMDSLKSNIGATCHSLQEKLDDVRHKGDATKQAIAEARTNLEQWGKEQKAEAKGMIDRWVDDHETQKLATRAQKAEDYAAIAIVIAQASIDDAERMVLEAIAARRDADAVTVA